MWNLLNDRQSKKYFIFSHVCMLSRVWLFCNPMNCSPPSFSVHGIFQARILEWVAISFSSGSSQPRDQTQASCIADRFFTSWATSEAQDNITKKQKDNNPLPSSWPHCLKTFLSLPFGVRWVALMPQQWSSHLESAARILVTTTPKIGFSQSYCQEIPKGIKSNNKI